MRALLINVCLVVFAAAACAAPFEKEIAHFQESDGTNPPPAGGILFIGSSSIRLWTTLSKDFPEYLVINRGFGGSEISHSAHYADRIVLPYKPAVIVMYAGGNDINNGKSPKTVLNDFKEFVRTVHDALPETRIAYISIAGNPARWSQVEKVREANRLVAKYTKSDKRLSFIDVFSRMLGDDGQPRAEIFSADKLHMNAAGYALWTGIVRAHLQAMDAPRRKVIRG